MNIQDYKFNVGDKVITTDGRTGFITTICMCDQCEERGFLEPFWIDDDDCYEHCISIYQAQQGFVNFYQIGKYKFHDFDKGLILWQIANYEKELKKLKKQLKVIEDVERI